MFSLWRKARRKNSAASRLLGSTSLRFALHGWQRMSIPSTMPCCCRRARKPIRRSASTSCTRQRNWCCGIIPSCLSTPMFPVI
ncbi:hypothetical protein [Thiolapillus sp.]|uniref:hypothetical protein n=1 Tax=Thiolapillus sp. TaxID=2017437 RepID=UPI0025F34A3B|nr:hypothetical protein [Thiolapillus sp.]